MYSHPSRRRRLTLGVRLQRVKSSVIVMRKVRTAAHVGGPRRGGGTCSPFVLLAAALSMIGCAARPPAPADALAALARGDVRRANEILRSIIVTDPEGMSAAVARDAMATINGTRALPDRTYSCPEVAVTAYTRAEEHFVAGRLQESLVNYEAALQSCPENADYWIHYGDAFFHLADYPRAKEFFLEGVKRDLWNRAGHRFIADTEAHMGNGLEAYHRSVLAVVSDPTYEAGWQFLREVTTRGGGKWNRVRAVKPNITTDTTGKPTITLGGPPGEGNLACWMSYGLIHWSQLEADRTGQPIGSIQAGVGTALQREEKRVDEALILYDKLTSEKPGVNSDFWRHMFDARRAGFLTEAIFINLIDRNLAFEYVTYRDDNWKRLAEYIETLIAPLPASDTRVASVVDPPMDRGCTAELNQLPGVLRIKEMEPTPNWH